jgi:hypothetical protein
MILGHSGSKHSRELTVTVTVTEDNERCMHRLSSMIFEVVLRRRQSLSVLIPQPPRETLLAIAGGARSQYDNEG